MNEDEKMQVAVFRFSVISDFIHSPSMSHPALDTGVQRKQFGPEISLSPWSGRPGRMSGHGRGDPPSTEPIENEAALGHGTAFDCADETGLP